ncbi:MAG: phosphatase [Acidimicrobiaceae bacterium]|nr:phosphatase [Acidimicrobiaceae bacterium]
MKIDYFILDVDGVLTDGSFYYSDTGKIIKKFGPHDADGLKLLSEHLSIAFVSADERGFEITKKRINDMGFDVDLVAEKNRLDYFNNNYDFATLAFMGDGYYDKDIILNAKIGIAPNNALEEVKEVADLVTKSSGGQGAVFEACAYLNNIVNESIQ